MKRHILIFFVLFLGFNGLSLSYSMTDDLSSMLERGEFEKLEKIANGMIYSSGSESEGWGLRGVIAFYRGQYGLSREYLEKAVNSDDGSGKWADYLYFVSQTERLTKDFSTAETDNFKFRYSDSDTILLEPAIDVMQRSFARIGSIFGYFPEDKINIEIYPDVDSFNFASSLSKRDMEVSGAIGIYKFNKIMLLSPRNLAFGYRWLDTLSHEYVHFVINRITGGNAPLWLHEGIARYYDTIWRNQESLFLTPAYIDILFRALSADRLVSFSKMSPSLVKLDSQSEVELAFAQVAHAVEYFKEKYGEKKMTELLSKFSEDIDHSRAFKDTIGLDMEGFELSWKEYLASCDLRPYKGVSHEKLVLKYEDKGFDEEVYIGQKTSMFMRLGDRYFNKRKPKMALVQYKKALENEPCSPSVLNKMGRVAVALEDYKSGEKYFLESIKYNPNYVTTYVYLGKMYLNKGFISGEKIYFEDAVKMYKTAIELNPFHLEIYKELSESYIRLGDETEARKYIRYARLIGHDDIELYELDKKIDLLKQD